MLRRGRRLLGTILNSLLLLLQVPLPSRAWLLHLFAVSSRRNKMATSIFQSCSADYAGLSATFDIDNGTLQAVPENLVPESLLEWGQAPICLETLTTEAVDQYGRGVRTTLTVLPETGCGVDNLEVIAQQAFVPEFVVSNGTKSTKEKMWQMFHNSSFREAVFWGETLQDDDHYRIRIQLHHEMSDTSVPTKIVWYLERHVQSPSVWKDLAFDKNGGLDGRSVATWLGALLNSEAFRIELFAPCTSTDNAVSDDKTTTTILLPRNTFCNLSNEGISFGKQGETLTIGDRE